MDFELYKTLRTLESTGLIDPSSINPRNEFLVCPAFCFVSFEYQVQLVLERAILSFVSEDIDEYSYVRVNVIVIVKTLVHDFEIYYKVTRENFVCLLLRLTFQTV